MHQALSGKKRARRGAAAVELAVLLPFLAFVFVLTVDFARVFYFSMTLQNCARNGALYASDPVAAADSPYDNVSEAALADASNLSPRPTVTSTNGIDEDGHAYVEVTVTCNFSTITAYPGIPNSRILSRKTRMRTVPAYPGAN